MDDGGSELGRRISAIAARRSNAKKNPPQVWLGLGVMGIVGWSVATPTLLGAMLGVWLDQRSPNQHSWTLALLVAGLSVGCFSAWHWVSEQHRAISKEKEGGHE